MEANQFDKSAKSRLSGHHSQMDVEAFWNQLEPKLPKDKSRPKIFILILLAGILLCSGALGWYFFERSKQQDAIEHSTEYPLQANKPVKDKNEIEQFAISNSNLINEHSSALADVVKKNNKDNVLNQKNNEKIISQHEIRLGKSYLKSNHSDEKISSSDENTANRQSGSPIEMSSVEQNESSSPIQRELYTDYLTKNFVLKPQSKSAVSRKEEQSVKTDDVVNTQTMVQNVNSTNDQMESSYLVSNIPLILQSLKIRDLFMDLNLNSVPEIEEVRHVLPSKRNHIKIALLPIVGIGSYTKELSYSGTDDLKDYLNYLQRYESKLEEWLLGFDAMLIYKNFGLLTGIEYVRRNEKFSFASKRSENIFGNTDIRVEANDTFQIISGAGWHGTTQVRKVVNYNSIQQWNVPLGLNYQFNVKGMQCTVGGGAMFSISNSIQGKTLDRNLNVVEWNQSPDLLYRSNLGVGWFGELNCTIPIANRIAFNTGFRIQEFPGSYLTDTLDLHYKSYLFRSGLIFNF
jgi:hypothetical protein